MIPINIISAQGGTGRSSLCLNMASLMTARNRSVRLYELDPENKLAFHMGLKPYPTHGLLQVILNQAPLEQAKLQSTHPSSSGFKAYAHGAPSDGPLQQTHMEQIYKALQKPKHMIQCLFEDAKKNELMLLDLPRWPNPWCEFTFTVSSLNLVVLTPDAGAVLAIDALLPQLSQARGPSYFLLNRMDPSRVLHLDIWTLLKTKLGHRLIPFYLHEDAALPESQAAGQTLNDYAAHSQLMEDLQKLCNWLDGELP